MLKKLIPLLVAGAAALSPSLAAADEVEDFYRGRSVTVILPFNPGGTLSRYWDLMGKHLSKHIPGQPTLTPEYMPGAGGLLALNYMYNKAEKDGSVIAMLEASAAVAQLLSPEAAQYDAREFNWIGVASQNKTVLVVRLDTGIETLDDMKTTEIFVGSSGAGSETDMYPRMTNHILGTKFNILPGYTGGGSQQIVALESGEIQGSARGWPGWKQRQDLIDGGVIKPMLVYGAGRVEDIPNVPNILEVVDDPDDQQIIKLITSIGPLGYGVGAPPGIPEDRLAALRAAFSKMLEDPEFYADAEASGLPILDPIGGEEAQAFVNEVLETPPELVERARKMIAIE